MMIFHVVDDIFSGRINMVSGKGDQYRMFLKGAFKT